MRHASACGWSGAVSSSSVSPSSGQQPSAIALKGSSDIGAWPGSRRSQKKPQTGRATVHGPGDLQREQLSGIGHGLVEQRRLAVERVQRQQRPDRLPQLAGGVRTAPPPQPGQAAPGRRLARLGVVRVRVAREPGHRRLGHHEAPLRLRVARADVDDAVVGMTVAVIRMTVAVVGMTVAVVAPIDHVVGPAVVVGVDEVVAADVVHDVARGLLHLEEVAVAPAQLVEHVRVRAAGQRDLSQPQHPEERRLDPLAQVAGVVPAAGDVLVGQRVAAHAVVEVARAVPAAVGVAAALEREVADDLPERGVVDVGRDTEGVRALPRRLDDVGAGRGQCVEAAHGVDAKVARHAGEVAAEDDLAACRVADDEPGLQRSAQQAGLGGAGDEA